MLFIKHESCLLPVLLVIFSRKCLLSRMDISSYQVILISSYVVHQAWTVFVASPAGYFSCKCLSRWLFTLFITLGVCGGYWVRRMRQLPRGPLENSTYNFVSLQMFFRDHYEIGTKSGKYKIDLR